MRFIRFGALVYTRLESSTSHATRPPVCVVTRPTPNATPGPSVCGQGPPRRVNARRRWGRPPVNVYTSSSLVMKVKDARSSSLGLPGKVVVDGVESAPS